MSGGRTRWTKPVQHQQLARRPNNPTPVLSVMAPIGESKNPIKGGKNEKKKFGISQVFHHHGRQFHHESKEPTNRQRHTGNSLFVCSDFSLVLCFSSTFLVGFRAKVFPYIYLFCIAFGQQNDGWVSYWSIQATQSAFMGHTRKTPKNRVCRERKGNLRRSPKLRGGGRRRPRVSPGCWSTFQVDLSNCFLFSCSCVSGRGKWYPTASKGNKISRGLCAEKLSERVRDTMEGEREREEEGRKKKRSSRPSFIDPTAEKREL